jgi:hypothetical protein
MRRAMIDIKMGDALKNIIFLFFLVFSHKTDKSEAKEPKAKRSCCSKNDLKMI